MPDRVGATELNLSQGIRLQNKKSILLVVKFVHHCKQELFRQLSLALNFGSPNGLMGGHMSRNHGVYAARGAVACTTRSRTSDEYIAASQFVLCRENVNGPH